MRHFRAFPYFLMLTCFMSASAVNVTTPGDSNQTISNETNAVNITTSGGHETNTDGKTETTIEETRNSNTEGQTETTTEEKRNSNTERQRKTTEKKKGNFICKEGRSKAPFVEALYCDIVPKNFGKEFYRYEVLMISDHWLLGQASQLRVNCRSRLGKSDGCVIGSTDYELDLVPKCKEIIVHEKYMSFSERYNIAAISSDRALTSFPTGPIPWPKTKGFADRCAQFSFYSSDENGLQCTSLNVITISSCSELFGKNVLKGGFICGVNDSSSYMETLALRQGVVVCDDIAVGLHSNLKIYRNWPGYRFTFLITKLEDYYTFIHKTTNVEVPFESKEEEEQPKYPDERPSTTGRSRNRGLRKEARRYEPGYHQSSSASAPQPCITIAFLTTTPILFTFLCY